MFKIITAKYEFLIFFTKIEFKSTWLFCLERQIYVSFHTVLSSYPFWTGRSIVSKRSSNASNVGRHLRDQVHSPHTCSSTRTPGPTRASTVGKDFIRNLTWRNTHTYILVCFFYYLFFRQFTLFPRDHWASFLSISILKSLF